MTDPLLIAAIALSLLSFLWASLTYRRLRAFTRTRERLFKNMHAQQLEVLLAELLERLDSAEEELKAHRAFAERARHLLRQNLVAPVVQRYNSYADIAGHQSFSFALLDRDRNGFVLSSLVSREGHRLYVKPLVAGVSEYPLSDEEKAVVDDAVTTIETP